MQDTIKLNNGVKMPTLGLGVFLSAPEETAFAVTTAIQTGYSLIDTAAAYINERQVGEGIRNSGASRQNLFITTKLWVSDYGYESALRAFDDSLSRLGLDYLDLYLLHWPVPTDFTTTVAAWRAAEKLLAEGRTRAIGVCNFRAQDLDALIKEATVVPAINQIELNPFFTQTELVSTNKRHDIVTQAWSPIGGTYSRAINLAPTFVAHPLQNPVVLALAEKYGKTPAQIVLRWHLEHGYSVIPKSVKATRIVENFNVFDFTLQPAEVASIDKLDTGLRAGGDPAIFNKNSYPVDVAGQ